MTEPRKAGAAAKAAQPGPETVERRGYVISEESEMALRDLGAAMHAVAQMLDETGSDQPDLCGSDYAALLRTFGRQAQSIGHDAAFANRAMVQARVH